MVRDGRLILQGKASCLPAAALAPGAGWEAGAYTRPPIGST